MKTIAIRCVSSKKATLSRATKILSNFVSADNCASKHIDWYLHKAYKAFNKLNQLHKERKPSQSSHTTDDSGRVVESSVWSVYVKPALRDENVDEKLVPSDVKFGRELNDSVVNGASEKHNKKDRKDKLEFGNMEGDGKLPKKEESGIELGKGDERRMEEGEKQKREEKKKDENSEGENAKEQEQQKEVEKKLSNGVKSENGGLVGPQDIEIRLKKKHESGSEDKLNVEEVKTEQRKKRKNKDAEERMEDRSGERSKKRTKRKHEG